MTYYNQDNASVYHFPPETLKTE